MFIRDSEALADFCAKLHGAPYVAIDTEFMGEKTYFPRLCLVQVAHGQDAAAIDPLARELDLAPLTALLADRGVLKVMHSGRQDLQILKRATGQLAAPIFDTQIAATVCDMGEQPGYDRLVARLLGIEIDKRSQATDWSRRPLTDRQVDYALGDVTHLCGVYERIVAELAERDRTHWVREEMDALLDPSLYEANAREAYRRIKMRNAKRRSLAILRELAAWREQTAIDRDLPRGWVVRDDALAEIALSEPRDRKQLSHIRGLHENAVRSADGQALLDAVKRALALPESEWPVDPKPRPAETADESLVALLQALLRLRCDAQGVALRLVASRGDLERLALDPEADIPALKGWRREVFGNDALALREGRIALTGHAGSVVARSFGR